MGARGPKPRPTALRVIDGNPSRRPINASEPAPAGKVRLPAHLTDEARTLWRRIVWSMPSGFYTPADEALLVVDIARDERFAQLAREDRYDSSSFMIAPLQRGGRPLGLLCATDRAGGGAFADEDLGLLRLLAAHACELLYGLALELAPGMRPLDVVGPYVLEFLQAGAAAENPGSRTAVDATASG